MDLFELTIISTSKHAKQRWEFYPVVEHIAHRYSNVTDTAKNVKLYAATRESPTNSLMTDNIRGCNW